MHNSRIIRKFERFLFKGIPEQPEPTWERNENTIAEMRQSGRAQANSIDNPSKCKYPVIGEFVYDHQSKKESYVSNL